MDIPACGMAGDAGGCGSDFVLCASFLGSGSQVALGKRYALWRFSLLDSGTRHISVDGFKKKLNMDRELRTKETYNRIAKQWASEHNTLEYWRKEFEAFSRLLPQGTVADVGCGAGRDYQLFREKKNQYDYVGFDYSSGLVEVARSQFPEAHFILGDMYQSSFENATFDGFWAAASLLHIPKERIGAVLVNVRRIIRPGGIGAIMLKKGNGEHMVVDDNRNGDTADERFFAYWQKDEFADFLCSSGFEIVDFFEHPVSERTVWLSFFVKAV